MNAMHDYKRLPSRSAVLEVLPVQYNTVSTSRVQVPYQEYKSTYSSLNLGVTCDDVACNLSIGNDDIAIIAILRNLTAFFLFVFFSFSFFSDPKAIALLANGRPRYIHSSPLSRLRFLTGAIVPSSRRDPSCHPHALPGGAFEAARRHREVLHSVRVLHPSHLPDRQLQRLAMVDLVHLPMV